MNIFRPCIKELLNAFLYIHIYVYTHIDIHTYVRTYIEIVSMSFMHLFSPLYQRAAQCILLHTYIRLYTYIHTYIIHTYTSLCIHTYIHIHTSLCREKLNSGN